MHVGDKYKNIIDRISIFDTIYTDDKCKNEVYTIWMLDMSSSFVQ